MTMTTPVRRQYLRIKQQHPDAILLFRLGDFYETFDEDAKIVARELQIALTSRDMGGGERRPLAGIPYHSLDGYLAKLIKQGYKVAICEQMTDPKSSKGLLEREVVRVVTPGTVDVPSLLEEGVNSYLVAAVVDGDEAGLAYTDVTTGTQIAVVQLPAASLAAELDRLAPAEVVVPEEQEGLPPGTRSTTLGREMFSLESSRQTLLDLLGASTLEGYGCEHLPMAIRAGGAMVRYLEEKQRGVLSRIGGLTTYSTEEFMTLDPQTRRNLELFQGGRWGDASFSLLSTLNLTKTPMGARLLRRWLGQPLLDPGRIDQRLDVVEWFAQSPGGRQEASQILSRMSDLERLANRVRSGTAIPRELVALGISLGALPQLLDVLVEGERAERVRWLTDRLSGSGGCGESAELIGRAMEEEPGQVGEGTVIRKGFSSELDELRQVSHDTRGSIAGLEQKERVRTGIRNLKVGYNRVFGYYIEVTRANLSQVPSDYERRQTLTGGERFITPELKRLEELTLNARERLEELEGSLYRQVCHQVGETTSDILTAADTVAHVDVFAALSEAAERYGYVRPALDGSGAIEITGGRHPVIEQQLPPGTFVLNDTSLSTDGEQLHVITGPNMSGKSTYLRQVALIVLMAQVGSFVPARSARIGVVDRIFTRVGLQDDLAAGQSTFMVEMVETASILNNATKRSLVILDEIGRGTSTYDGLSIAQAVAEYIHNTPRLGCRTLFATHYHELTELARTLPGVRNHNVSVVEEEGRVVFLHRIVPGGADKSYGVHVAQLAGLPREVIQRAWDVLYDLEESRRDGRLPAGSFRGADTGTQLSLIAPNVAVVEELLGLDVTAMTPMEAINALYALKRKAAEGNGES
ncbi:MAG: DNA mismatch repair protein MutS [Chloroflexi bacterium]|nr:DNA mismatch repair protein MutS [Chloroflexota bacterium]